MPAGNTNIFKEYNRKFNALSDDVNYYTSKYENFNEYLIEKPDIDELNDDYLSIDELVKSIDDFCDEMELILRTNRLIDSDRQRNQMNTLMAMKDILETLSENIADVIKREPG